MRKNFILISMLAISLLVTSGLFAQGRFGKDSAECVSALNFYRDYYNQKNYRDAAEQWRKAYKYCPPQASQNIFVHGRTIMSYLIMNHRGDAKVKEGMIDTLLEIGRIRAQAYPKYAMTAENNRVFDMIKYRGDDHQAIYNEILALTSKFESKVDKGIYLTLMQQAVELYQEGVLDTDKILELYTKYSPVLAKNAADNPTEKNVAINADFDNTFISSGVANCDNLVKVFTPRFEADPTNVDQLKMIVGLLSGNNCLDTDLFFNTVTELYKVEPSQSSAYFLYKLNSSRDNHVEALKYLDESIASVDSDSAKDGELLLEKATYYYTIIDDQVNAIKTAKEAIKKSPAVSAKANLLIGTIWTAQKCSGDDIAQRAKFWVAVDYFNKAKNDPEVGSEAKKQIAECSKYFPKVEDAFMHDLTDGKAYTVKCGGLSENTTVRTTK